MGYQLLADRDNPVRKAIVLMPQTPQATVNGTYLNDGNEQDRWVNLPGLTVNGNYWKRSKLGYAGKGTLSESRRGV